MHVFADLQSYICVHNDCPDILTTFPSRKAWFEHETTCHLSRHTICCPQCDTSYEKENDFLDHCERQHNMILRNPQLRSSALANAIVSYPEKPSSIQCALCNRRGFASLRDYSTHLGRELEEVSLYPLPDLDDFEEENEDDSEDESSGREITVPGWTTSLSGDIPTTYANIEQISSNVWTEYVQQVPSPIYLPRTPIPPPLRVEVSPIEGQNFVPEYNHRNIQGFYHPFPQPDFGQNQDMDGTDDDSSHNFRL